MVDILCAVLSGGNWGPTVDGFTTNKLQAAFTGDAGETGTTAADSNSSKNIGECDNEDEKTTGIGAISMICPLSQSATEDDRRRRSFLRCDAY